MVINPLAGMKASGVDRNRRSHKACNFCHRRKFKCNNDTPQCANCISYEQECVYDQTPKRARPSNSRIQQLEQENRRLKANLATTRMKRHRLSQSQTTVPTTSEAQSTADDLDSTVDLESVVALSQSDKSRSTTINTEGEVGYHGPSSLLCDDFSPEPNSNRKREILKTSESEESAHLMADAAALRKSSDALSLSRIRDIHLLT